ncbi:MAG TPA: TIGR00341 family protein, partial [Flavisolibacter sp.]|nr:TIGR00341 family protein [Flavisolibacter sp.]
IVESIKREVHFKGTNLWTLIFAIFIASIGLNVNSTAVIIGAMLISPLMGPIMGIGLAIGINDFELLQKGIKNLAIAAFISIGTSALYFSITPLHDANSELLARTTPSLWDVFIAFFGGLAGIVAGTRREKSNVIPGVAIATALMPPLCTAGFGLAMGNWFFLLGALYLFFINSLFICLASFLIVKHLKFHKKEFATKAKEKRVTRSIFIIVVLTILPSVFLAYRVVERSIFETNAKNFVQKEFHFKQTQVVTRNFKTSGSKKSIELLLIGRELSEGVIDSLKQRMALYGLDSAKLVIHQGLDAKKEIDLAQIKASILEDVFKKEKEEDSLPQPVNTLQLNVPDLRPEIMVLYPTIQSFSLLPAVIYRTDTARKDTLVLFAGKSSKYFSAADQKQLAAWLKQRIKTDSVKVIIE